MPLHPALIVLLALTFLVAVAGIAVVALLRLHRVLILQQYRVHLVRQALEALEAPLLRWLLFTPPSRWPHMCPLGAGVAVRSAGQTGGLRNQLPPDIVEMMDCQCLARR